MRAIADSGVLAAIVIPWNVLSMLASSALNIPAGTYSGYVFLIWTLPLFSAAMFLLTPGRRRHSK